MFKMVQGFTLSKRLHNLYELVILELEKQSRRISRSRLALIIVKSA